MGKSALKCVSFIIQQLVKSHENHEEQKWGGRGRSCPVENKSLNHIFQMGSHLFFPRSASRILTPMLNPVRQEIKEHLYGYLETTRSKTSSSVCFPSVNTVRSTERSRLSPRHVEFIVSWFLPCTQMWISRGGHVLVWKMIKNKLQSGPLKNRKKKKKPKPFRKTW